jgi:hypothetical protein
MKRPGNSAGAVTIEQLAERLAQLEAELVVWKAKAEKQKAYAEGPVFWVSAKDTSVIMGISMKTLNAMKNAGKIPPDAIRQRNQRTIHYADWWVHSNAADLKPARKAA